jgi:chemotaxis signal transduction protein
LIDPTRVWSKAAQFRNEFDRARAIPVSSETVEQTENLLAIRVSGDAFAIRLSEISGLAADRKIVALPSPIAELLGVAGIRGRLVPVYSLSALLGYGAASDRGRWLALCGAGEPVGLAINDLEGYLRVPLARVYAAEKKDMVSTHITQVVRASDMVRAVVSIPLIMEIIQRRCHDAGE